MTESVTEQLRCGYRTETEASGSAGSVTDGIIIPTLQTQPTTTFSRVPEPGTAGSADSEGVLPSCCGWRLQEELICDLHVRADAEGPPPGEDRVGLSGARHVTGP